MPAYLPEAPIDLSEAKKLKDVKFRCGILGCAGWIAAMLNTITFEHNDLQQVSIYVPADHHHQLEARRTEYFQVGLEQRHPKLADLKKTLIKLSASHAIHVTIEYTGMGWPEEKTMCKFTEHLFPGIERRGLILDIVYP